MAWGRRDRQHQQRPDHHQFRNVPLKRIRNLGWLDETWLHGFGDGALRPEGVGKSWVAQTLAERLGVQHVDVDALVLDLLAAGVQPDPADGWLAWVERSVLLPSTPMSW